MNEAWQRYKFPIIGAGLTVLLLIIAISFLLSGSPVKNNTISGSPPGTSSRGSAGLPDLAEAIARLSEAIAADPDREAFVEDFWRWTFGEAGIPERLSRKVAASALESPAFLMELIVLLDNDPFI
jgi:hypothetical protein